MLRMIKQIKIVHKLVLLMLLLIALVSAGFLIATTISFRTYDKMLYEQASQAMNLSVSSIENEMKNIEKLSMNMALDSRIQEQMISIRGVLSSYERARRMTDFQNKVLQYMLTEKSISSIRFLNQEGYDFFVGQNSVVNQEEQVEEAVKLAESQAGAEAWVEVKGSTPGLILAREIRSIFDPILEPLGILIFRVDVQNLVEQHFKPTASSAAKLYVLSDSGALYYQPDIEPFSSFAVEQSSFNGEQGYLLQEIEGSSYFLAYTKSTYTGWTYISVIPYDDIFQQKKELLKTILSITAILIIIALFSSIMLARGFTRPIARLTDQMRSAERGDFSGSLLEMRTAARMDEIGYLHKRFNSMIRNIQQLIDENYKKQMLIKDTEYRALQAQINPHFLYNTLNSINWMARLRNDEVISTMVESLSHMLRASINDKRTIVTVREELEMIDGYMYIQQVRYGKRIEFAVHIPEPIKDAHIPKFTLQPIVENAIYHAVDHMPDVCTITIQSQTDESSEDIVLSVADNGPGMDPEFLKRLRAFDVEVKGTGIGLRNIHERLQLIYGEAYGVEIDSVPEKGTEVRIKLPRGEE